MDQIAHIASAVAKESEIGIMGPVGAWEWRGRKRKSVASSVSDLTHRDFRGCFLALGVIRGNSFSGEIELQCQNRDFSVSLDDDPRCKFRSEFAMYISDMSRLLNDECWAREFSGANTFDMTFSHMGIKFREPRPFGGEIKMRVTEIGIQSGTGRRRGLEELTKWYKMKTQVV